MKISHLPIIKSNSLCVSLHPSHKSCLPYNFGSWTPLSLPKSSPSTCARDPISSHLLGGFTSRCNYLLSLSRSFSLSYFLSPLFYLTPSLISGLYASAYKHAMFLASYIPFHLLPPFLCSCLQWCSSKTLPVFVLLSHFWFPSVPTS